MKWLSFDVLEILCSIIECIAQLRKGNNGCISKDIQNALDSLIYVVYNLSRIAGMRKTGKRNHNLFYALSKDIFIYSRNIRRY